MRRLYLPFATALLTAVLISTTTDAAKQELVWPQFRGPGASGIAEGQNPPVEIGPESNVKWKVACPAGASSPIVVGDMLVLTAFDDEKLYTIAYRRADGEELWRAHAPADELEPFHKTEGSPAASTPATDGERIVSYFGSCGLFCYDQQGNEIWKYEMPPAKTAADFGTGVSPVIAGDNVVLLRDETTASKILAVDLASGEPAWEKPRQSISGFSTPAVWNTADGIQIAAAGFGRLVGYDLGSGEEKWQVTGMPAACCASPVVSGGNLYFAAWSPGDPDDNTYQMPSFDQMLAGVDKNGDEKIAKDETAGSPLGNFFEAYDGDKDGYIVREEIDHVVAMMSQSRNSAFLLKPGGAGDITDTHVVWKQKKGLPYVPTAIVYQGQQVMVKDGGIVTAYDAESGEQVYMKRAAAGGNYYASAVAAAGNIYFTSLDDGSVTVIKAGGDSPEIVAKNPAFDERVWATPAIADDTIYFRTATQLYAFAEE